VYSLGTVSKVVISHKQQERCLACKNSCSNNSQKFTFGTQPFWNNSGNVGC